MAAKLNIFFSAANG